MRDIVNLQAVTDRISGAVPASDVIRRRPLRRDHLIAAAMLAASAASMVASLGLWASGHGVAALRLFCGTVLLLLMALRLV